MMNPIDWNEKHGIAKPLNEEYRQFNNYLEQLKSTYFECYRDMIIKKKEINTHTFKKAYFREEENEYTLSKLMNYHNIDMKESVSWGTMKNYYTTQNTWRNF